MGFLGYIMYLAIALLILMLMVTIHEFGHYIAGKIFKFKINEFSIGFGKAIYSKQLKNGEIFSIRVVPLGGYCAFEGEDEDESKSTSEKAFNKEAWWKRLIVLFNGAFFNIVSAVIFSFILLVKYFRQKSKGYTHHSLCRGNAFQGSSRRKESCRATYTRSRWESPLSE